MPAREPAFWQTPRPGARASLLARLLTPIAIAYGAVSRWKARFSKPVRMPVPVICVGNVTLGGAGKTPVALAIAEYFQSQDYLLHFLSRGYGGSEKGPVQILPGTHTASQVGDEPLLLARQAPSWVSADRAAGAAAAVKAGARLIIMDDGFQNPSVIKNFSLLVVDAVAGIGNGRLFPAGPLREPLNDALMRADAVLIIGIGHAGDGVEARARAQGVPTFRAILRASPSYPLENRHVIAYAGIGRPDKFFQTLHDLRAIIKARYSFPDHHNFSERDAATLLAKAEKTGAELITTEKDFVRLADARPGSVRAALRDASMALPVRVLIDNFHVLTQHMQTAIARHDLS